MNFSKIKFDGSSVHVEYTEENDTVVFKSTDEPEKAFRAALGDLVQDVVQLCELPSSMDVSIGVRGVTWKETSDSVGFTISAVRTLSNMKVLVLNTPFIDMYDPDVPSGCTGRLQVLEDSAHAYILGKRKKQMEMFAEEEAAS